MKRAAIVLILSALLSLAAPAAIRACPTCAEAIPQETAAGEEDQGKLARAYNYSIYLMLGVPYSMLGFVGFLVYRQLRARAALEALAQGSGTRVNENESGISTTPAGAR
jgi:hypothetical protein